MRKIIAFSFLFALVWNCAGFFGYFQLERMKIRKEIKLQLKRSQPIENLKKFVFDRNEIKNLTWTKSNEFRWKNQMFDVVYTKYLKNNKIQYLCISDAQESKLFCFLDQMVTQDVSNKKPVQVWCFVFQQPMDNQIYNVTYKFFEILTNWKPNDHYTIAYLRSGFKAEPLRPPIL